MNHTCNPFCQGGVHALLMDPSESEFVLESAHPAGATRPGGRPFYSFEKAAANYAASYGLDFHGYTEVRDDALLGAPGTPTKLGIIRRRVIVWGTRRGELES